MRVAVIKESKNSAIRMASKRGEIYETGKFF